MFQITPVIKNIIIINVLFFIGQMMLPQVTFAMYPVFDDGFKVYQIVTNVFSHAGFNHLFFNMLTLVFLGTMLERQIDGKSFGIIYLLSAFGGLLINEGVNYLNAFHLGGSLSIVLGASGAVSGIVAALAAYAPNQEVRLIFPPIPVKMKWLALVFLVMDLRGGVSGVSDGVAHWVHIGGMATGFLLMKFWYLRK
jgi:membrane associated rhomboid family serine protease